MSYVLKSTSGTGYVRPCPPELGFEYVSNPADALRFQTAADALAYLDQEHPIRQSVPQRAGNQEVLGPIVGTFTRASKTTLQFYTVNIGDL